MAREADLMTRAHRSPVLATLAVSIAMVVAGCGGSAATASPTAAPASGQPSSSTSSSGAPSGVPSAGASAPTGQASAGPAGPATLDAPAQVAAGASFQVTWTGPAGNGDYVTIVAVGTDKWTNQPYFNTTSSSPASLTAPTTAGSYELWYVAGSNDAVLARRPIAVSPFVGTLSGPDTVGAGTSFQVSWTGPDGNSDYVTIIAVDAPKWTTEPYFYTSVGSTGSLVAPILAGSYELRYVTGAEDATMIRRPITVTAMSVTLTAPASVVHGAAFQVTWTGPDGPSDYITIAPAGSPDGTYLDYAYTRTGATVTITAPGLPGKYEIRYASDRVKGTFGSVPIEVK
jgi:Ca-activated chloride channel homolog